MILPVTRLFKCETVDHGPKQAQYKPLPSIFSHHIKELKFTKIPNQIQILISQICIV